MSIVNVLKQRYEIVRQEKEKLEALINLYADSELEKIFQETDQQLYKRPQKRIFQNNIGEMAREIAKELAHQKGSVRTLEVVMELRNKGYILNEKDGTTRVANYLTRSPYLESSTSGWRVKAALACNEAAIKYFGEFACLNKINPQTAGE